MAFPYEEFGEYGTFGNPRIDIQADNKIIDLPRTSVPYRQTSLEDQGVVGQYSYRDDKDAPDTIPPLMEYDWEIWIPYLPPYGREGSHGHPGQLFRKRIVETNIPGRTIERITVPYKASVREFAGKMVFDRTLPITIKEYDDSSSWNIIHQWMNYCARVSGAGAYFSEYATKIYLYQYTNSGAVSAVHAFHDCWPDTIQPARLSSQSGAVEYQVTFAYSFTELVPKRDGVYISLPNWDLPQDLRQRLRSRVEELSASNRFISDKEIEQLGETPDDRFSRDEVLTIELKREEHYQSIDQLYPGPENEELRAQAKASVDNKFEEYYELQPNVHRGFLGPGPLNVKPPNGITPDNGWDVFGYPLFDQETDQDRADFIAGETAHGETILPEGDPNRPLQIRRLRLADTLYPHLANGRAVTQTDPVAQVGIGSDIATGAGIQIPTPTIGGLPLGGPRIGPVQREIVRQRELEGNITFEERHRTPDIIEQHYPSVRRRSSAQQINDIVNNPLR